MELKSKKSLIIILPITIGIVGALDFTYGRIDIFAKAPQEKEIVIEDSRDATIIKDKLKLTRGKVKETIVFAEIIMDSPYYTDYTNNKKRIGSFKKGEKVEIIKDRSYKWYFVKSEEGKKGWVSKNCLSIPDDPETNKIHMSKEEIEKHVNEKGLESDTAYLIWVDIDRQLTHVFLGEKGNWKLHRSILSSTGKNISPTIRGLFKIQERGEWFYSERLKSGAKYWVKFEGPYLFHSLPMDRKGNITDTTLGKRASAGCIRFSLEDSKWFYKYVKRNSTVFIN